MGKIGEGRRIKSSIGRSALHVVRLLHRRHGSVGGELGQARNFRWEAWEMACRNAPFEVEVIEQLALIDRLPTHHDPPPSPKASRRRNHDSPIRTTDFFNSIGQKRTWCPPRVAAAFSLRADMDQHRRRGRTAVNKKTLPGPKCRIRTSLSALELGQHPHLDQ